MICKKLLCAALSSFLLLITFNLYAQDRLVAGKVTGSADGLTIPSATVAVKGSSRATQTDVNGNFSISVPATATTLIISSINYVTQEVSIVGASSIDISLVAAQNSMDEVVAVAYGTRRKGDLTGSVTAISANDFQKGNIGSPEQLIVAKIPGVSIISGGGQPGRWKPN